MVLYPSGFCKALQALRTSAGFAGTCFRISVTPDKIDYMNKFQANQSGTASKTALLFTGSSLILVVAVSILGVSHLAVSITQTVVLVGIKMVQQDN